MPPEKIKIIVIVGPTASGKSTLSVRIAEEFNGEVVSADSRQVYKGLDIATGKITKEEMDDISHHLLDVADPKKQFSVAEFKELADEEIENINARGKIPIITGGTGFYIQAIVDGIILPSVPPNRKLREELKNKSKEELLKELKKIDPKRAETVEKENPRRLIRAIEIARELGEVPELKKEERYNALQIGIDTEDDELRERIRDRTIMRLKNGMIEEAKKLHEEGLSIRRMNELGLEYKYLAQFLEGNLNKEELAEKIETADWQYSRRQIRWFKRDDRIKWFGRGEYEHIRQTVEGFLSKR